MSGSREAFERIAAMAGTDSGDAARLARILRPIVRLPAGRGRLAHLMGVTEGGKAEVYPVGDGSGVPLVVAFDEVEASDVEFGS